MSTLSTVCECALSHVELLEVRRFSPGWAASCNGMKITVFVPWRGHWSNFTSCEAARAAIIVSFITILVKSSNAVFEIAPPLFRCSNGFAFYQTPLPSQMLSTEPGDQETRNQVLNFLGVPDSPQSPCPSPDPQDEVSANIHSSSNILSLVSIPFPHNLSHPYTEKLHVE